MISPKHPISFQKCRGFFFHIFIYCMNNMHRSFSSFFCFVPTQKSYLGRAPTFHIHLDIHPSNTGLKLLYYYLYYVEASFPMEVWPCPFIDILSLLYKHNIYSFEFNLTIIYNYTTEKKLFTHNILLTDNKSLKVIEFSMIKYIINCNSHKFTVQ